MCIKVMFEELKPPEIGRDARVKENNLEGNRQIWRPVAEETEDLGDELISIFCQGGSRIGR